jgi:hypothetical protein
VEPEGRVVRPQGCNLRQLHQLLVQRPAGLRNSGNPA